MKKVLILTDHHVDMYNWRRELVECLLKNKYCVHMALPYGKKVDLLKKMGCQYTDISINRRGTNPVKDVCLVIRYIYLMKKYAPDVVLTYGTKPDIYGGIVCGILDINYIENVNGLGSGITTDNNILEKILGIMYKIALKKSKCVFFQNKSNQRYCIDNKWVNGYNELLPGSGVNLNYFKLMTYPKQDCVRFTYIARIMKEKGIDEFLGAAVILKAKYKNKIKFSVLGFCEEAYKKRLLKLQDEGIINYFGMQDDVRPFIAESHCIVMPSYYGEGMSNVLLESAACGRPIITTSLPGCGETVDDGVSGFIVEPRNVDSLIGAMICFLSMSSEERKEMGLSGRKKMEREFDRQIVVERYMSQIGEIV